jgi:RNA polymerase-binding transcription factor DksA
MTAAAELISAESAATSSASHLTARPGGPRWRALLEARWQTNLRRVTELSIAFHDAVASVQPGAPGGANPRVERLLRQAVAARRVLADTDEALSRMAAGRFGVCEYCAGAIPQRTLLRVPEVRYCPRCGAQPTQEQSFAAADPR